MAQLRRKDEEMGKREVTFDDLMLSLGNPGCFQILAITVMYLQEFPLAWATMGMAFSGKIPDWWCLDEEENPGPSGECPGCNNVTFQACPSNASTCSNPHFDGSMATLVSHFDLICDKKKTTALITSVQMAGSLVGAITAGQAADLFGRKKVIFGTLFLLTVSSVGGPFSVSWQMFSCFAFVLGMASGSFFVVTYAQAIEFSTARTRAIVSCFPIWSLGVASFGLVAWPLHDWQHLSYLVAACTAPFYLSWWWFPESVRWQLGTERVEEAEATIKRIARMNKRPIPDLSSLKRLAEKEKAVRRQQKRFTFIHLYNSAALVKKSAVLIVMWMSASIIYYGITLGARNLVGNLYLNIAVSGLAEIPRIPFIILVTDKLGRRWGCFIFFALSSVACAAVAVCAHLQVSILGTINFWMAFVVKMTITAGWAALKLFTSENYPTVIRGLAIGNGNIAAGIGSIIAPYIVQMNEEQVVTPYAIMAVMLLASALVPFLLPETLGRPLTDMYGPDVISPDAITAEPAPADEGGTKVKGGHSYQTCQNPESTMHL